MNFMQAAPEELLQRMFETLGPEDIDKLLQGFELASEVHGGGVRGSQGRGEGAPSVAHPVRVMFSLFAEQGVRDIEILLVALLHDILERSQYTVEDLGTRFGDKVAASVELLTRQPGVDRETYAMQIEAAPFEVFLVEMAARLDNLRAAYTRKKSLQPYFNETRRYYLRFAERRSRQHPELKVYTEAMRMVMESE